jgi:hypothetical protein
MALLALATGLCAPSPAQTSDKIEPAAMAALNGMGAYLRTLKVFQVEAQTTSEDVLVDGLKVQFAHTTNILARMPDRLLAQTDGDLRKRLYLYDGKNFTLFAMRAGYYATVPAPPTIVQLADVASKKYDVEIPLVDLFLWGGPHATTSQITVATDIGPADVGGITCEHYVFRQPGLDWQVWIQKGDFPLPKKMVLTTTTDEARPQHTSVLTWNLAPSFNDAAFTFDPPADAHRIVFAKESDQN